MCSIRTKWKWVYKELLVKFQHVIRGSMECSIAAASWDKIIANVWVGIRIPEVLISFYLKSNSRSKLPASAVQDCIRRSNFIKMKWMRLVLIFGCPCPWPWEMILKKALHTSSSSSHIWIISKLISVKPGIWFHALKF